MSPSLSPSRTPSQGPTTSPLDIDQDECSWLFTRKDCRNAQCEWKGSAARVPCVSKPDDDCFSLSKRKCKKADNCKYDKTLKQCSTETPVDFPPECGTPVKQIKVKGSVVSEGNVDGDACDCEMFCAGYKKWVFTLKNNLCECYNKAKVKNVMLWNVGDRVSKATAVVDVE